MQQSSSYLIFSLNNRLYGLNSNYFEEVISLPELILLPEINCGFVGTFDLRGETVPVLDLNNKLGYPTTDYRLSDSLLIVQCSQLKIGIIINGFSNIRAIASHEIVSSSNIQVNGASEPLRTSQSEMIAGTTIGEEKIWILNNLEAWIVAPQIASIGSFVSQKEATKNSNSYLSSSDLASEKDPVFCPDATNEERAIFRSRAESLKAPSQAQELTELQPIIVFVLGSCLWGIDSGQVQEFVDIKKITPVPCCPIHIIGNANLRGEILTLIDIRKFLDVPILEISAPCKVIVAKFEDAVVGIRVDSVLEATFLLNSQAMISAKTALPSIESDYLQGAIAYKQDDQRLIGILNLPNLLFKSGLVVDELV